MKKPKLYVQSNTDNKLLAFDFCYDAMIGAHQVNIKTHAFKDIDNVPITNNNIIVGSVEVCKQWLYNAGYDIPTPIPLNTFYNFLGRDTFVCDIDAIDTFPIFIKPYLDIKAFTGFIAYDKFDIELFSNTYTGPVQAQTVVDIVSEYRAYITNNKLLSVKHYSGDPLIFPDAQVLRECLKLGAANLDRHSYTLDFGVLADGSTILIEANDGWAIGNYGLEPLHYYIFVRNRWLQITGVRKEMDYVFDVGY